MIRYNLLVKEGPAGAKATIYERLSPSPYLPDKDDHIQLFGDDGPPSTVAKRWFPVHASAPLIELSTYWIIDPDPSPSMLERIGRYKEFAWFSWDGDFHKMLTDAGWYPL